MPRKKKYDALGTAVSSTLAAVGRSQPSLAREVKCSTAYVNHVITGRRSPSGEWVDLIAAALEMSPEERAKLHLAAARRAGYNIDIDLIKK